MFGDGVFGPAGVVWCCALVIVLPVLYVSIFSALMRISFGLALRVTAFASVVVAYLLAGYLFGDPIGLIAAAFALLAALPTLTVRTQRRVITFGREKAKRVFRDNMSGGTFVFGDQMTADDDHIVDMR